MDRNLEVEVTCLGRILEGEGKIKSTLEDHEIPSFTEALSQSIGRVEEPNCAACIDGRCTLHQVDGSSPKRRPRKAGASLSSLETAALGSDEHLRVLEEAQSASEIYDYSTRLQHTLGNRVSAHIDCGAAGGPIEHNRSVSHLDQASPTVRLVSSIMAKEAPEHDTTVTIDRVIKRASRFSSLLERVGWQGTDFVEHVSQEDPAAVEVLEMKDDEVHGHSEDAVVVIDGPTDEDGRPHYTLDEEELYRLTGRRVFPVNMEELRRDAAKLTDPAEGLTAGLLYHFGGVYYNLGDGSQPLFVVSVAK
jgi:hypothetical protein